MQATLELGINSTEPKFKLLKSMQKIETKVFRHTFFFFLLCNNKIAKKKKRSDNPSLYHILLIRINSLGPANTPGKGFTPGHAY